MINTPTVASMDSSLEKGKESFVAIYGGLFEHSPWIASTVWDQGIHGGSVQELSAAFGTVIRSANRDHQLALLRAHPQLACAIASAQELTAESRAEQRGAGLDRCSAEEFEEFSYLNRAYLDRFGFPFIIAVRQLGRGQILESFRARLNNGREEELQEALEQVIRIGNFRLQDVASGKGSAHGG